MLESLKELPNGTVGFRAIGKVSREDYTQVFVPLLDEARHEEHSLRFMYQFGPEFGVQSRSRLVHGNQGLTEAC